MYAYLATTLASDKETASMSNVIKKVACHQSKARHYKDVQAIGLLERYHSSIRQAFKIETGERSSMWHKYVNIAVRSYSNSYHTSLGSEPSRVFHERNP